MHCVDTQPLLGWVFFWLKFRIRQFTLSDIGNLWACSQVRAISKREPDRLHLPIECSSGFNYIKCKFHEKIF